MADEDQFEDLLTPGEFRRRLRELVERGHRSHIVYDRAWTFREPDAELPGWMVEITELQGVADPQSVDGDEQPDADAATGGDGGGVPATDGE